MKSNFLNLILLLTISFISLTAQADTYEEVLRDSSREAREMIKEFSEPPNLIEQCYHFLKYSENRSSAINKFREENPTETHDDLFTLQANLDAINRESKSCLKVMVDNGIDYAQILSADNDDFSGMMSSLGSMVLNTSSLESIKQDLLSAVKIYGDSLKESINNL